HNIGYLFCDFGKGPNGFGFHVDDADRLAEIVRTRKKNIAGEGDRSLNSIRTEYRMGAKTLNRILAEHTITPEEKYFKARILGYGIGAQQFATIKPTLEKYREMHAGENEKALHVW